MTERKVEKTVWFSQTSYNDDLYLYRPVKCEVERGNIVRTEIEYNKDGTERRRTDWLDTAYKMDDGHRGWEPSSETHLSGSFDTLEECEADCLKQNIDQLTWARVSAAEAAKRVSALEKALAEFGYEDDYYA